MHVVTLSQVDSARRALSHSCLTLGTAALGHAYAGHEMMSTAAAARVVHAAVDHGFAMVDTAPTYGSESLVGIALCEAWSKMLVATKVSPHARLQSATRAQIHGSLRLLRRDRLDLVQLHNPTAGDFQGSPALAALHDAQARGLVRWIGASVYTEEEALAAIKAGLDAVQVPYNLLDQRMSARVFAAASEKGVAVLARSPWLRGALTDRTTGVSPAARKAADRARRLLLSRQRDLPAVALRFCLRQEVASVIIGPRTVREVEAAARAAQHGPLNGVMRLLSAWCATDDEDAIDPRRWDRK